MSTKPSPSASTQQQPSNLDTAPDRDQVRERAYYRYVERGRADGKALDDWLGAEAETHKNASSPGDS